MEYKNLAYDLSIYEDDLPIRAPREKNQKPIKARTKFGFGTVLVNIVSMAVMISLALAVISSNVAIAEYSSKIARVNEAIVELESEKSYLELTLEGRFSLEQVEDYAVNTLGYTKLENYQISYINLETENSIDKTNESFTDKVNIFVQPILSYLLP